MHYSQAMPQTISDYIIILLNNNNDDNDDNNDKICYFQREWDVNGPNEGQR